MLHMKSIGTYRILFLIALLLGYFQPAQSQQRQPPGMVFNKVYPAEGKTFEHVTGMVQDQQGYMWFVSKKGLFKYDGYRMISYKNNPLNSNSVGSNLLESICTDSDGMIWIGTLGAGLDRFDPATGNFTHFRHNPKESTSLSNDTIASLLYDRNGTLWVGTHQGLDRFDPKTKGFIHYRNNPNDSTSISNNQVRSLYEDRQRTLWIGTGSPFGSDGGTPDDGGLNRLNKSTGKFTRYLNKPGNPRSLINNKVRAMFEDSRGNFWVGTAGDGLHAMDRIKGTFKRYRYDPRQPEKLSRPPVAMENAIFAHITFITEDALGRLWIGSADAGLSYYDPESTRVKHFTYNAGKPGEFGGSSAWAAYTSRDGILWISNMQGDLFTLDPFLKRLPYYASGSGAVGAFYEEPNGNLWIGSTGGLIKADRSRKVIKRFVHDRFDSKTLSSNTLQSIAADSKGRMWIGTSEGLNLFNRANETFTRYLNDPRNPGSLSNNFVVPVYEDRQRNLWVGTMKGLNLFNQATGSFTHYIIHPQDTFSFGPNLVTAILEDRLGKLWIGAWGQNGVNEFNKTTRRFRNYFKGASVSSLLQDSDGILWVGADDGLYQFNSATQTFSRFVDPSSIAGISDVISMAEDNQRNLWIASSYGIIRLNPQRNATTLYGESYGVKENSLVYTSAYKGPKGELFFGDTSGYFAFFPTKIAQLIRPPEILLTALKIANKPILAGSNAPFSGSLWKTKKIKFSHDQNVFSFDFATISYSSPEANRTLYMLENYDSEWRIADKSGRAYYFNVPPGNYVLKLKAANSHGVWAQKDIEVLVTPPWWQTWWAYILFIVLFFSLIRAIIQYRSRNLIREKNILEEKVKSRTVEVVKQKEEILIQRDNLENALDELKATQAQLIQREKMASLGELTSGIAHEIQNPLNFVNNFSDVNTELIEEMKSVLMNGNHQTAIALANNIAENEHKIQLHGKRADAIVKGMLQHSRSSIGKREPTDINDLADEYLRLAYHGIRAKDKTFCSSMDTDLQRDLPLLNIIPQDIGRVLLNLYNNAFYSVTQKSKQKEANYEPKVEVSTKRVDNRVQIKIRDNGLGIPDEVLEKIFQPFFTTKPAGQGTGLGLSLSYDIIKAHGGELSVKTKEGEFAEFTIFLPV